MATDSDRPAAWNVAAHFGPENRVEISWRTVTEMGGVRSPIVGANRDSSDMDLTHELEVPTPAPQHISDADTWGVSDPA